MKQHIRKFWVLLYMAVLLIGVSAQSQLIWTNSPTMSVPRKAHKATMLKDGRILLVGGEISADNSTTSAEIYDPFHNDGIVNLALASRGSTITGNNGANWDKLIDGVTTGYTGSAGFGYTTWSPTPGTMTLDLKALCTISSMRLLLWDLDRRYYRYKIEASMDSTTWTTLVDRTTTNLCRGWQDIGFNPPIQARYLRLMGTYNSTNVHFHVVEWEVYGAPSATLRNADRYVSLSGAHVYPFTNWMTAATNIQAAVDAAVEGETVLVSNGIYATGGRVVYGAMSNRVVITKPVTVRSVNGPAMTIIQGAGPIGNSAVRCAYVGTNAVLEGFMLTNGATRSSGNVDRERCGGGVWCESSGALSNCILTGNSASSDGGGVSDGTLYNCTLTGNSASYGGGVSSCRLYNCTLSGNSAGSGGGAGGGILYNCTLTGNSASHGGGVCYGTLYNCIVYHNDAARGANYEYSTINYSCTTPDPDSLGNITSEPQLASSSHLSVGSPCQGAGHTNYAMGTDIDGEAWRAPPSMGCDEVVTGTMTGALSVSAWASPMNVAVSFPIRFRADILGRTTKSVWDFGDGTVLSNKPYALHAYASPGVYAVLLQAYNESYPQGITATVTVQVVAQAIHYVKLDNATPLAPYTSWATAATNIQEALDAASQPGALVLVSNGTYATGGRVVYGALTNRVAITNAVTVRSVNGPAMTIIQGAGPMGDSAVRCAYVGINAVLEGFTLTNGATRSNGDYDRERRGGGVWCESSGVLSNCILAGNSAFDGGGACWGTLYHCMLTGNSARYGGGAYDGTLYHCTLTGNSADYGGGGGAFWGTLYHCTLSGNSADYGGGGASWGTLYNCTLSGNSANFGGGASDSTLYNCTLIDNSAFYCGGGVFNGTLHNCIVYYNEAVSGANYYDSTTINYSCTTPDPGGLGNITSEPQLASSSHLSVGSPCQGAGHSDYATGTDIDGEAWRAPPSMGCDEVVTGAMTGVLSVSAWASPMNVAVSFPIRFRADILGRTTKSVWDFGDGTVLSNKPYALHAYASPGVYAVLLQAYNESYPQGITATVTVQVVAPVIHYVKLDNATPLAPYTSWATAATNIQEALDAASQPGALVLVSNGTYATGGRVVYGALTNRVAITNAVTVRSVNGPAMTIIQGAGPMGDSAVRCVYVGSNAVLEGFTLAKGSTRSSGDYDREQSGGGVCCESSGLLRNCTLIGNSATYGGGASWGTLYNCLLTDNASSEAGGGAYWGRLYNCTLTDNSTSNAGGGTCASTLYNCIVYYNTASRGSNYDERCTLSYSCTTPHPGGTNNITDEPQFVNAANGDYRLLPSSPCIDRGINQNWMFDATDLSGNPRILNGTVDMGAYEFFFQGNFKVRLQGPYDTNTHEMTTALNTASNIPLTSPYADDPRRVSAIPSKATDWVLLQLQRSTNSTPFFSKSVFLGQDGNLLSDGGATNLMLEASTGSYYVVVKHRNHLAGMSANPAPFTNRFVSYDFTLDADQYYGNTNGAIQLESHVWGLIAGDADGDGEILGVDALLYNAQTNSTGYKRADFNLDGVVSKNDREVFWNSNVGRCTMVAQGETILKPALKIHPGRRTLLTESEHNFSASGGTGTITWAFVKNPSGGTNSFLTPTSMVYRAGTTSSCIDILEAWDPEDRLGRTYVNVISSNDTVQSREGHHPSGTQERGRSTLADHGLSGGSGL